MVINPKLFKLINEIKETKPVEDKEIPKPELPINFSICRIYGVDYFQYCLEENGKKNQLQKRINSYNIQEAFNNFINEVNDVFQLNIKTSPINNSQNWQTSNKIIVKEDSEVKIQNRDKSNKYNEKKKAELGEEAYNQLKAQKAREYREKKKAVKQMEI